MNPSTLEPKQPSVIAQYADAIKATEKLASSLLLKAASRLVKVGVAGDDGIVVDLRMAGDCIIFAKTLFNAYAASSTPPAPAPGQPSKLT